MSSKTQTPVERDDALFDSMAEERKRRKRKLIRTVVISAAAVEPEEARQTALRPPTASTWTP